MNKEVMCTARNFRININLCLWFHDHRHKARIFISDEIQTIRDLENRIEKIFKIKNFHLTSQNEYLPPSEDVRILQKDDTVWVMKNGCDHQQAIIPKVTPTAEHNTEAIICKKRSVSQVEDQIEQDFHPRKKKKKKHDLQTSDDAEYTTKRESKKKKKPKEYEDTTKYHSDEAAEVKVTSKEKKKKLSSDLNDTKTNTVLQEEKSSSMNINTLLPVLQSHIKSYNKKVNNWTESKASSATLDKSSNSPTALQNNTQSEVSKTKKRTYECKGTLSSYKKKVSVPTITDKYLQEKKVNIVQIEYLSGGPANIRELESMEDKAAIQQEKLNESADNTDKIYTQEVISARNDEMEYIDQSSTLEQLIIPIDKEQTIPREDENKNNSIKTNGSMTDTEKSYSSKTETLHECNISSNKSIPKTEHEYYNLEGNKTSTGTYDTVFNSVELSTINRFIDDVCLSTNAESLTEESVCEANISNECINEGFMDVTGFNENSLLNQIVAAESETAPKDSDPVFGKPNISFTEKNKTYPFYPGGTTPKTSIENMKTPPQNITENIQDYVGKNSENNADRTEKSGPDILVTSENIADTENIRARVQSKSSVSRLTEGVSSELKPCNGQHASIEINEKEMDSAKPSDRLLNTSMSSHGNVSTFSRRKRLSGIGELLEELRTNESAVTGESLDSDQSEFVTVRKRKRIRKRKKKSKGLDTSLDDSSIVVTRDYIPQPIRSKACPTMHIKFEEEEGSVLKVVDVSKSEKKDSEDMEISRIENITVDSDNDQLNITDFSITERDILKAPSIKNLLPKVGEIIAFKILRITENYTPEISSFIIGKVIEFNSDNKAVLYEILNGLDECKEPQGILSIEEEEKCVDNNRREFIWTDIIDPRLLFP